MICGDGVKTILMEDYAGSEDDDTRETHYLSNYVHGSATAPSHQ